MRDNDVSRGARGFALAFAAGVLAFGVACSSGDDDSGGKGGSGAAGSGGSAASGTGGASSGATGGTTGDGPGLCGTSQCPAGQYCVAGTTCTPGCTTDADCAQNEDCEDIDDVIHVGTCKDLPVKDCAGFIKKCSACAGGTLCTQQSCDALSAECVNCVAKANCDDSGTCPCD
jgi:hypothetical protein